MFVCFTNTFLKRHMTVK